MLDADYLEQVTKDMEKTVGQMNDYLIEKIAKRIDALFRLNGEVKLIQSSIYDVRKAEQAGMLLEDIAVEVQKRLPHIEAEVKAAFLDAADKISVDTAERTREVIEVEHEIGNLADISLDEVTPFEAVGLPRNAENLNLTPKEIRLLESAYRQSRHDVKNFTRTMPNHGQDLYIRLCDEAYMKVRHGVSLDAAICEAIEGAAKQGISTVSYGGRTERAEVAIARAVRTGVNRASGDIVLCRCAEMGVNHVLVSQHLGARVTGTNDFRDHSQWQGKVYKLDWNKPSLAKYQPTAEEEKENDRRFSFLSKIKNFLKRTFVKEYPDFIDNCGYGEMLGICGINCRHTFTQFYPKINKNIQKPYDSEENRKKYETEQRQRAMERAIRKTRTKIKATEAVTQTPEVENELQRLRKLLDKQLEAYDKYCSDNHLSKQNYRIRVAGGGQVHTAAASWANNYKNKGLAANGDNWKVPEHTAPVLEGKIDLSDAAAIERTLTSFEKETVNAKIENACVITRSGEIYRCYGTENSVFPDADLKDRLVGAIVSHNHPADFTEFSFSKADFELFNNYQLEVLRGVDVKYKYEFNRNKVEIDKHRNIFDLTEEDAAHEESITRAERAQIGYKRWLNE